MTEAGTGGGPDADSAICPVCSSTETRVAFAELPQLRRCATCGLVWSLSAQGTTYEGEFFGGDYYGSYFSRAGQWRHEAALRLRWLLGHDRPAKLLEVGCGGGFFLAAAREEGIDVAGVEPSADGSRYARDELGLPVVTGTFEGAELTGPFDAVCAFHVLEHVEDARGFLEQARGLLAGSKDGVLALEVPNIESARARRDGATWFNLVPEFHRWHFSPASLTRLVAGCGFRIEAVDTAFPRHYFRLRRIATKAGVLTLGADLRARPTPRRTHPRDGDYLRLVARPA